MASNKKEKLKEVLTQTILEEKRKEEKSQQETKEENNTDNKNTHNTKVKKNINLSRFFNYFLSIIIISILFLSYFLYTKKYITIGAVPQIKKVEVIKEKIVPKEVKVEVIKEKIVPKEVKVEVVKEKIVDLNNKNFKKYYFSDKFNIVRCYSFNKGSSLLPSPCQSRIYNFLEKVKKKNLIRIELVPIVAKSDNVIYKQIENKIKDESTSFKNTIRNYLLRGLTIDRISETTEFIRKKYKNTIVITPTNYFVRSVKNNKGIMIKAYYSK